MFLAVTSADISLNMDEEQGMKAVELKPFVNICSNQTQEEKLYSQKKCKRCFNFFSDASTEACYYHPGTFVESYHPSAAKDIGWTCCRVKDYIQISNVPICSLINEKAMQRNAKGCEVSEKHQEDPSFSRSISSFPFHLEEIEKRQKELQLKQDQHRKKDEEQQKRKMK
eukprot:TRINITY_DN5637_c0_g1_i2.p1 TRINITY_DN5637_c0_g1~~TRINITY_DN5637_c0_g1_i2.p1  ORF type:complete len:169 (-),score=34.19 TRINITY_DN5637_c0_g1_i2:79-585(-)